MAKAVTAEPVEEQHLHGYTIIIRHYPNSKEYDVSLYKGAVNDLNLRQRIYCQTYPLARTVARKIRKSIEKEKK